MQNPRYEYSRSKLAERIQLFSNLSSPNGLIVRYAVKANPHPEIVSAIDAGGIHFDASSSYEAEDLLKLEVPGDKISLSSQQSPHSLEKLLEEGVLFVAASKKQLKQFLEASNRPRSVGVRINPDMGAGHNNRTSTGGVSASFGIWHEYIPELIRLTNEQNVLIDRLHIHVGSGADPKIWGAVIERALEIAQLFPGVVSLNIGGGYKIHRYGDEEETDIELVIEVFNKKLNDFERKTGRKLQLEIEPGTFFVAHIGTLVAEVDDIVDTGEEGYSFLRLNTGMNDFLRSAMYGSRHKIEVINESDNKKEYVVVGHNCESGDIFTPSKGNPEEINTCLLNEANIGDEVLIYDTGAYCASMRAKGYNSFPDATEVFVD
jgi:diaminopimelate decarboxylase